VEIERETKKYRERVATSEQLFFFFFSRERVEGGKREAERYR
jgi:hypothetical protein